MVEYAEHNERIGGGRLATAGLANGLVGAVSAQARRGAGRLSPGRSPLPQHVPAGFAGGYYACQQAGCSSGPDPAQLSAGLSESHLLPRGQSGEDCRASSWRGPASSTPVPRRAPSNRRDRSHERDAPAGQNVGSTGGHVHRLEPIRATQTGQCRLARQQDRGQGQLCPAGPGRQSPAGTVRAVRGPLDCREGHRDASRCLGPG